MADEQKITRRDVLRGAAAAGLAGGLALTKAQQVGASTEWYLASPMYASITDGWHNNALDMAARSGSVSVYAYFRRSGAYGYVEIVDIRDSCETPNNPTHRLIDFYVRTDGAQSYVGSARAQHVQSVGVIKGSLYACPVWLAEQGAGGVGSGIYCYTGLHVHYWANGAQVGTYAYGDLTYLDTPVMWKWIV